MTWTLAVAAKDLGLNQQQREEFEAGYIIPCLEQGAVQAVIKPEASFFDAIAHLPIVNACIGQSILNFKLTIMPYENVRFHFLSWMSMCDQRVKQQKKREVPKEAEASPRKKVKVESPSPEPILHNPSSIVHGFGLQRVKMEALSERLSAPVADSHSTIVKSRSIVQPNISETPSRAPSETPSIAASKALLELSRQDKRLASQPESVSGTTDPPLRADQPRLPRRTTLPGDEVRINNKHGCGTVLCTPRGGPGGGCLFCG